MEELRDSALLSLRCAHGRLAERPLGGIRRFMSLMISAEQTIAKQVAASLTGGRWMRAFDRDVLDLGLQTVG